MIKNKLPLIALSVLLFVIFYPWFSFDKTLSSGDWPHLYPENIAEFQIPTQQPFLWIEPYHQITAKIGVEFLNLSWETTEKIFWFIPLIFLGFFSSATFLRYIFKDLRMGSFYIALGSFLYLANTYFLMVVGGGQLGVAFSYGLAPLTLFFLIKALREKINFRFFVLSSLVLAVQIIFDPRIFLLTLLISLVYFLFHLFFAKTAWKKVIPNIIGILSASVFLNLFWIIPNISYYQKEFSFVATEPLASFLSFATFPNSISLLHPNWPENIFGKIGFMKPEFIPLAIFAYISLFFINIKNKKQALIITSFALIGLIGSFLGKGVNPPLGGVYELFSTLPSSSLFRDPTKFYLLISISYSILVPLSVYFIYSFLNKSIRSLGSIFVMVFIFYIFLLLKPAFFGELSGTFKPTNVPSEYIEFKNFITEQNETFNYLSVPESQRFLYSSRQNSAIGARDLFASENIASVPAILNKNSAKKTLIEENIKYIVVPYDLLGEIFVADRKYDNKLYIGMINSFKEFDWLQFLEENGQSEFGRIAVFEVIYK